MAKKIIEKDVPGKKDKEAVKKFAESIIEDAVNGKKSSGVYSKYKRGLQYWDGIHKISANSDRQGNQVWNKFAEIITNRTSQVASTRPKWIFKPQGDAGDIFTASALNQIIGDVIWEDVEWEDKGEDSLLDTAFAGSGHIKTSYRLEDGWPVFDPIPCSMAYPDNKATSHRNRRYFVHVYPMNVDDIKEQYGIDVSADDKLNAEERTASMDDVEVSFEQASSTSFTMENIWNGKNLGKNLDWFRNTIGQALMFEVWLEDKSKEKIPFKEKEVEQEHEWISQAKKPEVKPEENHLEHSIRHLALLEGMEGDNPFKEILASHLRAHDLYRDAEGKFTGYKRSYPRGRVIHMCQGKLCNDRPNPLPIPWQDVFIKYDWWKKPLSYWGKPLTNDLFDPQDALNHRKNAITKNINSQNTGIVLLRRNLYKLLFGDSNKSKIKSRVEGHVMPSDNPTQDLHRDNGPQLPAHVVNDPMITEDWMERNSGNEGIMAGRYPKGSPPMGTVEDLMEQANKPINVIIGHYSFALKKMARNAIAIMNEYMDERTKFRILVDEPVELNGNNIGSGWQFIDWKSLKDRNGMLDVRVDVIDQMSTTKDQRFRKAIMKKQFDVYDAEAVLVADDDPMKFDVMRRRNEIGQLRIIVQALDEENKELKTEVKTLNNRLQGSDGSGNTGKQTSKEK